MSVKKFDNYMELSKALNNSWGTGTTTKTSSFAIKFSAKDENNLKGLFAMVVNMPNNPRLVVEMKNRYKEEALRAIQSNLVEIRKKYEENTDGSTIKLTVDSDSIVESVEYLSVSSYRPNLSAMFRVECLVKVTYGGKSAKKSEEK